MELVVQIVIGVSLFLLAAEGHLLYGRNMPPVAGPPIPLFKSMFGDWLTPREPYHPIPMINPFDTVKSHGLNHFDKGEPVPLQREEVDPDSSITAGLHVNENHKKANETPKESVSSDSKVETNTKNPSANVIDSDLLKNDLSDNGKGKDTHSTDSRSKEDLPVNNDQDAIFFPKENDENEDKYLTKPPNDSKHDNGKVPTDSKNIHANLTATKLNHTKGNDSLTPNSDIVIIVPNTPTIIAQDGNGNIIVPFPSSDINLNSVLPISGTTVDDNGNVLVPINSAGSGTNVAPVVPIPGGTDSNIQVLVPISNSGINSGTNSDTNLQNVNVLFPITNGANNVNVNPITGNVITAIPNTKQLNVNPAMPAISNSPVTSTSTSFNLPNVNNVVTPITNSVTSPTSIPTNTYTDLSKTPIMNGNNQGNNPPFTNANQYNQNQIPNNGNAQVSQNNSSYNAAQNNQINPIPISGSNIISQITLMPVNGGKQNGNSANSAPYYITNGGTSTPASGKSVQIDSNSLPVTNIPNTNAEQNSGVLSPVSNLNINTNTQTSVPGTNVVNGNSGSQTPISGVNYITNSNNANRIPIAGGYFINANTGAAIPVSAANYIISGSPGTQTSLPSGTYFINGNSAINIPANINSGGQSPVSTGAPTSGNQSPISGGTYINSNSATQVPVTDSYVINGNSGSASPIANYVIGNSGTQSSFPSGTYVINGNSGIQSSLPSGTYVINGISSAQVPVSVSNAQWPSSNTGAHLTNTANPSDAQSNAGNQPNIIYTTQPNQPYILVSQNSILSNSPQSNSGSRQPNQAYTVVNVPNGYSSNPSNVILLSYPTNSVPSGYTLLNLSGNSPLVYYKLKK